MPLASPTAVLPPNKERPSPPTAKVPAAVPPLERRWDQPRPLPTAPGTILLLTRLKVFARDAGQARDPLAYFAAIVQKAYTDSGYAEPSDQEARELVKALAAREPSIERVLDSLSVVSAKGGDGGR